MRPRSSSLGLTSIVPLLLSGCFLFAPPAPTGPTPEEIAAAEAAREEERKRQIEEARTDFVTRADTTKAAFEANPDRTTLFNYYKELQTYRSLEDEAKEGIDFDAYLEVVMTGTAKMLEPHLAKWANKKERTPELRVEIKAILGFRVDVLMKRKVQPAEYAPDGVTMLAMGPLVADYTITSTKGLDETDRDMLDAIEELGGRPAVHTTCKAALDQVIAEDKKDTARQHYVMAACALWPPEADWLTDLHAWATEKQTKTFLVEYAPYREQKAAEAEAQIAQLEAEYHARKAAEAQAEIDARNAESQGGGGGGSSSSSSSSASSGPVSITVRNSCGSTVKFFWGDDPKFGSGRTDSLGGNSRTSTSAKVGQVIWLTDDNRNGIASVKVSSSTREVEFSCSGVSAR